MLVRNRLIERTKCCFWGRDGRWGFRGRFCWVWGKWLGRWTSYIELLRRSKEIINCIKCIDLCTSGQVSTKRKSLTNVSSKNKSSPLWKIKLSPTNTDFFPSNKKLFTNGLSKPNEKHSPNSASVSKNKESHKLSSNANTSQTLPKSFELSKKSFSKTVSYASKASWSSKKTNSKTLSKTSETGSLSLKTQINQCTNKSTPMKNVKT